MKKQQSVGIVETILKKMTRRSETTAISLENSQVKLTNCAMLCLEPKNFGENFEENFQKFLTEFFEKKMPDFLKESFYVWSHVTSLFCREFPSVVSCSLIYLRKMVVVIKSRYFLTHK